MEDECRFDYTDLARHARRIEPRSRADPFACTASQRLCTEGCSGRGVADAHLARDKEIKAGFDHGGPGRQRGKAFAFGHGRG